LLAGLQAASAPAPTDPYSRRHAHLSRATLFAQLADNLSGARNLTQTQLVEACGTDAKLDPGLTLKPCQ
jgi:hypothetical protein